jgi:hypothetical protein
MAQAKHGLLTVVVVIAVLRLGQEVFIPLALAKSPLHGVPVPQATGT